jgi:16S rRNA (adenine1518-N6/adenine1519-N6)-dimethyltransferase
MILTELLAFLKKIEAKPRKGLSQNFLIDPNIVRKIVELAEVKEGDQVLEIGPGPGALTKALLDKGAHVFAVETDSIFARELERLQNGHLTVFHEDFLHFDLRQLPPNLKVVANLPYHITTPILEKLFAFPFSTITIMVQKEVAERMIAKAGSRTFGSLSLFVQFHSQYHGSFKVPASCFFPKPKVDSTVLRLNARQKPEIDPSLFFPVVHKAFQRRRKMLSSTFPKEKTRIALSQMGIRIDARPETLSLEQWIELIKKLV